VCSSSTIRAWRARALPRLLYAGGYQTVAAEDGWDAWDVLGERRFDAVVTALEMPRVDGSS